MCHCRVNAWDGPQDARGVRGETNVCCVPCPSLVFMLGKTGPSLVKAQLACMPPGLVVISRVDLRLLTNAGICLLFCHYSCSVTQCSARFQCSSLTVDKHHQNDCSMDMTGMAAVIITPPSLYHPAHATCVVICGRCCVGAMILSIIVSVSAIQSVAKQRTSKQCRRCFP